MNSCQHSAHDYPLGQVRGPGILYGGIGLILAMALEMAGLFKKGDVLLMELLSGSLHSGVASHAAPMSLLLAVASAFCFGVGFAVLDSPGILRRVVLGVSALILVLAMVPTFAVWDMYFSPFLPVIALFWTWFCCMMYANHHHMPCDASLHHPAVAAGQSDERYQTDKSDVRQQQHPDGQS